MLDCKLALPQTLDPQPEALNSEPYALILKPRTLIRSRAHARDVYEVRGQQMPSPGHLWRDKWTAQSGPLSRSRIHARDAAGASGSGSEAALASRNQLEGLAWCKSGHATFPSRVQIWSRHTSESRGLKPQKSTVWDDENVYGAGFTLAMLGEPAVAAQKLLDNAIAPKGSGTFAKTPQL